MSELDTYFESGTPTLTDDAKYVKEKKKETYLDYISNSIYLRNAYNYALEDYFETLKNLWLEETKWSSNVFLTTQHPAHINIIKLGSQILPFLLNDLKENKNHWFIALGNITGDNPVKKDHQGNIDFMISDWLKWGEENNII